MPSINCEINLILTWSENCVISEVDRAKTLTVSDTKLYVPVVTLPTQNTAILLQELNWVLKEQLNI